MMAVLCCSRAIGEECSCRLRMMIRAEGMSKVLMLARDSEIRDPGILEQLRG